MARAYQLQPSFLNTTPSHAARSSKTSTDVQKRRAHWSSGWQLAMKVLKGWYL